MLLAGNKDHAQTKVFRCVVSGLRKADAHKIESGLDAKGACGPTATSDVLLFFFPNPLLDF